MKTLKRMMVALLALLPMATGMAIAETDHGYSRIFIFGASFMDSGNHFADTGLTAHPPFEPINFASYGIGGHRPTNGRTWVEVLAQEMELTEWAKPAYRDPAFGNYAYAYGRAREVEPEALEPSLFDQVQAWKDNGYCTGAAMSDTLFIVDSGYRDGLDILQGADPELVIGGWIDSIATNIFRLYQCGARNLLVPNLGDLGAGPLVPPDAKADATALVALFNYVYLQAVIDAYSSEPFNMNISTVDFFGFTKAAVAMPEGFSLTNVTDSCITPYVTKGAFCKDRDEYFWWDNLHPTKEVHAQLAEYALGYLPKLD